MNFQNINGIQINYFLTTKKKTKNYSFNLGNKAMSILNIKTFHLVGLESL